VRSKKIESWRMIERKYKGRKENKRREKTRMELDRGRKKKSRRKKEGVGGAWTKRKKTKAK
jgi:hypothetical protein